MRKALLKKPKSLQPNLEPPRAEQKEITEEGGVGKEEGDQTKKPFEVKPKKKKRFVFVHKNCEANIFCSVDVRKKEKQEMVHLSSLFPLLFLTFHFVVDCAKKLRTRKKQKKNPLSSPSPFFIFFSLTKTHFHFAFFFLSTNHTNDEEGAQS